MIEYNTVTETHTQPQITQHNVKVMNLQNLEIKSMIEIKQVYIQLYTAVDIKF